MEILDTIDYVLEFEDKILPTKEKYLEKDVYEELFPKIADFILNLDINSLNNNQIEEVISIMEMFELDNIKETIHPGMGKMSTINKNSASKKWYSKNKNKVKKKKDKLERSGEGKKREKMKERLKSQGKSPTGRKRLKYHRRKRSDRYDEYDERENG